jgi:outer membrane protein OmpA-like peptidoglycan-associated protein
MIMTVTRISLGLAGVLALAAPAAAAPQGWYLGLGAGAGWQAGTANFNGANTDTGLNYHPAARFSLAAGYKSGNWRAELEPNWVSNNAGLTGFKGGTTVIAGMANGLYDFALDGRWTLSAGAGVGVARVSHDIAQVSSNAVLMGGHDTGFAWQAIAGISYRLRFNTMLGVEYRYMSTGGGAAVSRFGTVRFDNGQNQIVMATLRWYPFLEEETAPLPPAQPASPPPPPAPPAPLPPPPPPVRTYVVFFDFDRTDISAEARATIAAAVQVVKSHGFAHILVTGHTDTMGSMRYNQALSEKRAAAVKGAMTSLGVPSSQIATSGKSFSDPLVPTGAGVREPRNRRAVIDLDD